MSSITGISLFTKPYPAHSQANTDQTRESLLEVAHKTFGACNSSKRKTATSLFERVQKRNLAENKHPNYESIAGTAHTTFQADSPQSVRVTDIKQASPVPLQISQQSAFHHYVVSYNQGNN